MLVETVDAFVDEMEKIALSASTIASAAKKRGVPVGYLKAHSKALAESAIANAEYKISPGKIPEVVRQRNNAQYYDGQRSAPVGKNHLDSWLKSHGHRLNPETQAVLNKDKVKDEARLKRIAAKKTSKE